MRMFIVAMLMATTGFHHTMKAEDIRVVNALNLTEELACGLMKGDYPNTALEIEANTILPLHLFMRGNLIDAVSDVPVSLKQTVYLRYVGDNAFLFSTDLVEWKNFQDFFTGQATICLSIQDGAVSVQAGVDIDLK